LGTRSNTQCQYKYAKLERKELICRLPSSSTSTGTIFEDVISQQEIDAIFEDEIEEEKEAVVEALTEVHAPADGIWLSIPSSANRDHKQILLPIPELNSKPVFTQLEIKILYELKNLSRKVRIDWS
jgi:hypothetical protein